MLKNKLSIILLIVIVTVSIVTVSGCIGGEEKVEIGDSEFTMPEGFTLFHEDKQGNVYLDDGTNRVIVNLMSKSDLGYLDDTPVGVTKEGSTNIVLETFNVNESTVYYTVWVDEYEPKSVSISGIFEKEGQVYEVYTKMDKNTYSSDKQYPMKVISEIVSSIHKK